MNDSRGAAERQSTATALHLPGEVGIWVFITGDLLVFSLFFGTFLYYRNLERALFSASQATLSQNIGLINTFLMLTSSWFVARSIQRLRANDRSRAAPLIVFAFLCGAGFLVNKAIEWGHMIGDGHTLLTNNYYMMFYMLTGIHALHVLIGMGVLFYLWSRLRGGGSASSDMMVSESVGIFWHLVDLLWIVLFSLLYLVR